MHTNPHFITKREGWGAIYNDLRLNVFATRGPMETLTSGAKVWTYGDFHKWCVCAALFQYEKGKVQHSLTTLITLVILLV